VRLKAQSLNKNMNVFTKNIALMTVRLQIKIKLLMELVYRIFCKQILKKKLITIILLMLILESSLAI